jgi:hypothetical protein
LLVAKDESFAFGSASSVGRPGQPSPSELVDGFDDLTVNIHLYFEQEEWQHFRELEVGPDHYAFCISTAYISCLSCWGSCVFILLVSSGASTAKDLGSSAAPAVANEASHPSREGRDDTSASRHPCVQIQPCTFRQ